VWRRSPALPVRHRRGDERGPTLDGVNIRDEDRNDISSQEVPEPRPSGRRSIVQGETVCTASGGSGATGYDRRSYKTVVNMRRNRTMARWPATTDASRLRRSLRRQGTSSVKLALGLDPVHRGTKFACRRLIWELLGLKLSHPLKKIYLFDTLVQRWLQAVLCAC